MFDVTAIIMHDPATAYRRPPTPHEVAWCSRPQPDTRRHGRPPNDVRLLTLPNGGELVGLTQKEINVALSWLRRNLMAASVKKMPDGRFRLRRVA